MGSSPSIGHRLLAISGTLTLIVFLVLGLAFGAWAWAWVVFLIPGAIGAWQGAGRPDNRTEAASRGIPSPLPPGHEGAEPGDDIPPPRGYPAE